VVTDGGAARLEEAAPPSCVLQNGSIDAMHLCDCIF